MDEVTFEKFARDELSYLEEQLMDVDPDDVDVSSSDGVLRLELRDGVRIVINSHRAAGQIWMAAVSDAWRFDRDEADGKWRTAGGAELRSTLARLIKDRLGVEAPL